MSAVRMRLSRAKGFRLQAASRALNGLEAVAVARPGRWGNPFPVETIARGLRLGASFAGESHFGALYRTYFDGLPGGPPSLARLAERRAPQIAAELFAALAEDFRAADPGGYAAWLAPLKGRNLACWCGALSPCHGDVLLRLAAEVCP